MKTEAINLRGKTIADAYINKEKAFGCEYYELVLEFTDETKARISNVLLEDEITGNLFVSNTGEIEISL